MSSDRPDRPAVLRSVRELVGGVRTAAADRGWDWDRDRERDPDAVALAALATVALAGLALRLFDLGGRVFHWDEGRVGYWTLRYAATGAFEYAPIIHGPFLPIVNGTLFDLLGATDAVARLPVALVGGLLPLAAWLFRGRLDRGETVALGLLLAFNPLLVYYSRFMRNDVLVGGFAVVALGFAVRALDARDARLLYPAAAALALSATTKANTLLYVLCYAGAALLLVDGRLVRAAREGRTVGGTVAGWRAALRDGVRTAAGDRRPAAWLAAHAAGVAATVLAVIVFFYAPRPDLYAAAAAPGAWPGVVAAATVGAARDLVDLWIAGGMQGNPYLPYLTSKLGTLAHTAAVVCGFAVVGFAVDGYGGDGGSRPLVAFAAYWAVASLAGYPMATDIDAPWSAVHVVLPLTIPAAVGLAWAGRRAVGAARAGDRETAAVGAVLLLIVCAGLLGPTATYWNAADADRTEMVQYAQPENDLRASLDDAEAIAATHDGGTDVLFVGGRSESRGSYFHVENESVADRQPAAGGWYDRLPLPWYLERAGADVRSSHPDAPPAEALAEPPPVVIAAADRRGELAPHLDGYHAREHEARLWGFRIVVFRDRDALAAAGRPVPE